jgi:uncharacterized coiled-coil protein SlyX
MAAPLPLQTQIAALETTVTGLNTTITNLQTEVTNLGSEIDTLTTKVYDLSGNLYNLQNTVNEMKTKTDYITNSKNKIKLNSLEFNMRAGDAIVYREIKVNNTIFSLNHSI